MLRGVIHRPFPPVQGVAHHYVTVDGVKLHYAEAGPPDAPVVVLVHGWPQHWYMWRRVIPRLAREYRVIAMDLRGYGWSDAPDSSYAKEEFASDLLGLIRELGLRDVRLAGHDWGGFTGFLACLREPEHFRSFLALSITHPWPNQTFNPRTVAAALAYQPLLATPVLGPLAQRALPLYQAVFKVAGGSRIWDDVDVEAFADAFREPDRARAASRTYRTFLLHEAFSLRTRYRDRRLTVPTRLVVGMSDPVINEALVAGGEAHGDDFTIEYVPGGHFLPEESPDLVVDRLA
jgi:pimeloyl-ACP methyl ester carboxylesterase